VFYCYIFYFSFIFKLFLLRLDLTLSSVYLKLNCFRFSTMDWHSNWQPLVQAHRCTWLKIQGRGVAQIFAKTPRGTLFCVLLHFINKFFENLPVLPPLPHPLPSSVNFHEFNWSNPTSYMDGLVFFSLLIVVVHLRYLVLFQQLAFTFVLFSFSFTFSEQCLLASFFLMFSHSALNVKNREKKL